MPALAYHPILFDLDGTLTDPKLGITKSIRHALAHYQIAVDDLDSLIPFIGPPLAGSFERYYGFDATQAHDAVEHYRDYFAETGIFENSVYPGIPTLLAQLRAQDATLVLATSKPTIFAERILQYFDLRRYFALVIGSNLDGTMTDKAAIIRHALAQLPSDEARNPVMIGDREHDIIGGRSNDIATIAVTFGYGTLQELESAQPTTIVYSVADLAMLLCGDRFPLSIGNGESLRRRKRPTGKGAARRASDPQGAEQLFSGAGDSGVRG